MKNVIFLLSKKIWFSKPFKFFFMPFLFSTIICFSCNNKSSVVNPGGSNTYSGLPTRISGSPYPISPQKPDTLFVIDESKFTDSQVLTIQSLQGLLAQSKPRIYCIQNSNDSYSIWLNDLQKSYGVIRNNAYISDFEGLLNHFKNYISGYILTTLAQPSIDVAISEAGLKNAIVVVGTDTQTVQAEGIPLLDDVANESYQQFINNHKYDVNQNILCYQTADKFKFLSDYAVFGKMFYFFDGITGSLTNQVFSQMKPNSALLGWGTDEFQLVQNSSKSSIIVHAADFAMDLSTLSNFGADTKQSIYVTNPDTIKNVHTVCFLMTDGDNVQWLLNDFSTSSRWYGSADRGKVNIGWTVSPALCELAPTVLKRFYDNAAQKPGRDYFVAAPSGLGYVFPEVYSNLNSYAALTAAFMKKADLHIVNLLGNSISSDYLTPFLQQDQIDAVFYYYYSNYSGGNGQIYWVNNKPVITGRYNLWTPQFESPQSLAAKLNSSSTDITSPNGYSLIPVHVWSHSVDDIIQCVSLLNKNVRVVSPDQFVALIKKNISH
ncbi:MAG: GxGYxYP domain-containing protein [Ignavibacteriaceae bacterium]